MSDSGDRTDPRFVYLIGRADRGLRKVLDETLSALDLTTPEYTAMSVLARRPGLSNAQLARRSLISPQSMIHVISRLEERSLVKRKTDPSHGRILRAQLTKRGERLLSKANERVGAAEEGILADLSQHERAIVRDALAKVVSRLRDGR